MASVSTRGSDATFLTGGGQMGALMRTHDWAASPLGDPEGWPQSLRSVVQLMLNNRHLMFAAWGPELAFLYNDGYAPVFGKKHPWALGRPFREVWPEIWDDIKPLVNTALAGEATWSEDLHLVMERNGYPEDCWYTFSYSPVRDEGGNIAGMFCAGSETTARVLAERRREALLRLDDRLRDIAGTAGLSFAASETLGESLGAVRVGYGALDPVARTIAVERGWNAPGFADIAGVHHFSDYGSYVDELLRGTAVAIADVEADPRTAANAASIRKLGIRAHLDVPVFEDGRAAARMFVHSAMPRVWTDEEAAFVRDFAERTHAAIARRAAETALRESEARLAFLDLLSAETAALIDADTVLATTTRLTGEHLGLSVCAYADMDEDQDGFSIRGDWAAPGSKSIVGHYSLADFGKLAVKNLSAGLPLVVNDNLKELAPEEAATFQNIGIAATICMPLVKEGRLTALMAIHDRVPRVWTEAELSLLREVTARSWAHVERVAAAAELRESEARFRLMADAVPQIVWITDADGRAEFFNKQWTDYTGVSYEPTTAAEVAANHIHLDDAEATVVAFDEARRTGGTFLVEHRIRSRTGELRWFLVRGEPYRDPQTGDVVRWFGASVDIHDRKLAEARLRELNETLEAQVAERTADRDRLWRSSQDLLMIARFDTTIVAVNPAWTAALGWSEAEMVGVSFMTFIHPDDLPTARAEAEGLSVGGRTAAQFEIRYRAKRGDWASLHWSVSSGAGHFHGIARDVTADRARQAELETAQEALRQSQKMEAMGQLTGGVAHDFNNLLTPIIGSLDMLVRRGVGSERERRLIDGALQSADRAKTLVQRLLAFARRQPLQPVPVGIPALVEGMVGLIGSTLGPTIDVRVDLAPDLPPAKADSNQLEMALLNLAVNARDAMPDGGELTIKAKRESVRRGHASGLNQGHYVQLCVVDTGVGMDEATRQRAIEPFFSTKGVGKGTGLGLSMVHGLAAQLGGGLTIESAPGKGTAIELWLPISTAPSGGDEAATAAPAARVGRGVALLVDDEDLVRMSTASMLIDLGFEVVEAGSAEEALQLLKTGTMPNLLITDHLMPGMNGADLAREARATRPNLPVLIVSGYAEVDGLAPDLPRLTKPFRNAELAASVSALMTSAAA